MESLGFEAFGGHANFRGFMLLACGKDLAGMQG